MLPITGIPPDVLRYRHRLSVQQINALFGREVIGESLEERAGALVKVAEFIRVTDLLRSAGIEFVPLKGPLLSYRLYDDSTVRRYGDLDILVDSGQVERTRGRLLAAGYTEYMFSWPESERGRQKALKYWHHIAFRNPDGEVITELHWKLSNRQWLNFRDADRFVRENSCTLWFSGNSYRVLSPEAELLYLVIHGGAHRWGMLKWLVDIHRYLERIPVDTEKFCSLVDEFGCGRLVTLCNRMLSGVYSENASLPCGSRLPRYLQRMAVAAIENPINRGPETIVEIIRLLPYAMGIYPGPVYKLKVLWEIAGGSLFRGRLRRLFD